MRTPRLLVPSWCAWIVLIMFTTTVQHTSATASNRTDTSVSLRPVVTIPTEGCAGFDVISIQGETFLAVANFWDGTSRRMLGHSRLYHMTMAASPLPPTPVEKDEDGSGETHNIVDTELRVSARPVQEFTTYGAHGADFFVAPAMEEILVRGKVQQQRRKRYTFLTIPNYYACGSARGPAASDCESTVVYRLSHKKEALLREILKNHSAQVPAPSDLPQIFKVFQKLPTAGPAQTHHILSASGRDVYLVVGENFNHEVCLYRLRSAEDVLGGDSKRRNALGGNSDWQFVKHQCLDVHGAGAIGSVLVDGRHYLFTPAYHNSKSGWSTQTQVFVADDTDKDDRNDGKGLSFKHLQSISTHGCHDVDILEHQGAVFVLLSNDRSSHESSEANSTLLRFDRKQRKFKVLQEFPTRGAHGGDVFVGPDGHVYVFMANFGDRLGKEYVAMSTLWRQRDRWDTSSAENRRWAHSPFEHVAEVPTFGATDAKAFVMTDNTGNRHNHRRRRVFIAVANEGDLKHQLFQESVVYELLTNRKQPAPPLPVRPTANGRAERRRADAPPSRLSPKNGGIADVDIANEAATGGGTSEIVSAGDDEQPLDDDAHPAEAAVTMDEVGEDDEI